MPFFRCLAPMIGLAVLAACAEDGPYPSLAPRPAERAYAEEAARAPAPPAPLPDDPAVAERAARLAAEANQGDMEFNAAYGPAAAAAERAGPAGSDSWVAAQEAVSRAASAQGRTTGALADLDRFALDRARAGPLSESDRAQLAVTAAAIQVLADGQAERMKRLEDRLRTR